MNVSSVILNWKGFSDTKECMKSILLANRSGINLQIIVVDNGSDDGSYERLKKIKLDGVSYEIIETGKNLGYAGGNNVGIRHAINHGADFILVVNNDVAVDRDIFSNFIKASRRFGRFGALSPKIYFAKGFEYHRDRYSDSQRGKVIWYAGGEIDWENVYGLNIGADEVDEGQYDKQTKIDFATGACVFFKTSALKKIGLFDEKYFMYLEDVDISVRLKRGGFEIFFVPDAVAWHKVARSSGIGGDLNDYFISRNRMLFGFKYASIRAKLALLRESFRILASGREWQKRGIVDFYLMKFGMGSWNR